jgi:zinc protease
MKRAVAGIVACLVFLAGAIVPGLAQERELVTFELDNGLRVALAPDSTVPKVAMFLRYRVGSMNEPAGRAGFAHLFEHLMFSGTTAWPNVFAAHLGNGNDINAWTSEDGTVYYAEGVAANLPMILSLEADRMANLGGEVEQAELDLQRAVVKNEMRQNVLDQAGSAGWLAAWTGLFPQEHPYSRAVIGSIADLDAATLDDVRGFFNTYYVPNNAVLSLVGDFDVAEARALVEQTFGVVPRGPDVATPDAPDTAPTAIRIELEDRLPTPWMMLAYNGPRAVAADNGALALAAELLGSADFGFLRDRVIADKGLATSVSAYWTPGLLAGRFTIDASALSGVDPAVLETELRAAVDEFLATPIDAAELESARQNLLIHNRLAVEPYGDRAAAITEALDIFGDGARALADDPRIVSATAEEVLAAARAVLDPSRASMLVVRPGERGDYPRVLVESSGEPAPLAAPDRPGAPVPVLSAKVQDITPPPQAQTATLSNGASLIHYVQSNTPMTYVAAMADGGWDNAEPGQEGLFSMAVRMGVRGAGGRDLTQFTRDARAIGAVFSYRDNLLASGITMAVPVERFEDGAALLADAVLRPAFDEGEWRQVVATQIESIGWELANLSNVAWNAVTDLLQPPTATRPASRWIAANLADMDLADARATYERLFQPSSVTFVSVGPQPIDAVKAGLETAFEGWTDSQEGFEPRRQDALEFSGRQVLVVPEPGASQSAIVVLRPAPGSEEPGRSEAIAVMRLLGGDFNSRLNSVIREEKGYSYGVGGGLWSDIDVGSALYTSATVDRENTGPAMQEFLAGFASLSDVPATQEELIRTINTYRGAMADQSETGAKLFNAAAGAYGSGTTIDEVAQRHRAVAELKLEAVQAAAPEYASLDNSVIVIAGDTSVIVPQLEAIGLKATVLPAATAQEEARSALAGDTQAPVDVPSMPAGRTLGLCAEGDFCEREP